jgi:hypothetical protein
MDSDKTPIDGESPRQRKLPEAAESVALALEENVVWRVSDGAKVVFEVVRRPFEDLRWALQRRLVWPGQDRFEELDGRGRAIAAGGGLAVIAVSLTGLLLATSGGSGTSSSPPVAVASPAPIVKAAPAPAPKPAAATLHGAAPVFKPAKQPAPDPTKVGPAKAVESPPAESTGTSSSSSSAATDRISSDPGSTPTAGTSSAELAAVDGPPAGKEAIAVAHQFSNAFVVFETGGDETTVRKAFAATATPALAKSLLKRPPRLPANVKVPEARVLNIVAGPSHGGIYDLSVSLLRVGVTSELRLEMEKLKGEGWRVTNVLG